jgi:hypothetical protein
MKKMTTIKDQLALLTKRIADLKLLVDGPPPPEPEPEPVPEPAPEPMPPLASEPEPTDS